MPGAGLGESLPPIRAQVVIDDTQLKTVGKTAGTTGAGIEAGMTKGTGSLQKFAGALSSVMGLGGLGGLPPVALKGEQALTGMTSSGLTGMGLLAGGTLAAVGVVGAVV